MKDTLIKLLARPEKSIEIKDLFLVENITLKDDLDLIELNLLKNKDEYQGIVMIKGDTFPVPIKGDIIFVKKIYLKYNQVFDFKLYIEGNVVKENIEFKVEEIQNIFSFGPNDIFDTLSKISEINLENIYSTIFIIERRLGNILTVKSLSDSKEYSLEVGSHYNDKLKPTSFLWLNIHELLNNKIETNKLTTFEILNDEQLVKILNLMCFDNLAIYKVIDVNEDNIIVININYNIFNINKKNDKFQELNIQCCEMLIISNYKEENNEITLTNKSFIYKLNQNFHYLDIRINSKAILKLYVLDYNNYENKYDTINYSGKENENITISNKEMYLLVSNTYKRIYEYFPFQICLLNKKKKDIDPITFTIYIYNCLINKINVFVNTNCPKTYFYEYLYYNITQPLKDIEKKIIINNKEYNITAYDNFSSENRRRICLLNIPYQNIRTFENELVFNSIQINELIMEDKREIVGINDISSIEIKKLQTNSYLNEYYPDFGDIYNLIFKFNLENKDNILKTMNIKVKKFNKIKFQYDFKDVTYFEDILTLSQFKTWIGLIICDYMSYKGTENSQLKALGGILEIFISILTEKVNNYDFIRIFIFLLKEKLINKNLSNMELQYVSQLDKLSPYLLAYKFNIEQIENLTEYNPLFQAYLQFDSFEAYNYIHKRKSYTFSLEMNFMIKHRLLSAYESFFIIKRKSSEEYAYLDHKTKLTVINEVSIFNDNKKDINTINDIEEAKNCAIPIVINFSHEKSGHFKFLLKNDYKSSPVIYFKGLRTELEIIYKDGYIDGETGNIIEKYICDDPEVIYTLSTDFIYGELLQSEYFNGDENKLKTAVKKINNNYNKKKEIDINKSPRLKVKKKNKKSIFNLETLSNLPRFYLYGCLMLDTESIKKELMISKEEKEEMFKKSCMETLDEYKKMDDIYENNKKLYEKYFKK